MQPRFLVTAVAAALLVSLTACSGGSTSQAVPLGPPTMSPTSQPSQPAKPTPPPTTNTPQPVSTSSSAPTTSGILPPVTSEAGQGAQAQQAMFVENLSGSADAVYSLVQQSPPPVSILSHVSRIQQMLRRPQSAQPSCTNQQTLVETPSDNNQLTTYVLKGFSDSGCTLMEYQIDLSMGSYVGAAGPTLVGNGVESFYDSSQVQVAGTYLGYVSVGASNLEILGNFLSTDGTLSSAFGVTCVGSSCSGATAMNSSTINASFGNVVSYSGSGVPTVAAFVAPLNSLALTTLPSAMQSGQPPFYSISGSTTPENVSVALTSTGYNVVDATNGAEVKVTIQSNGAASGIIIETSNDAQVATFSVDQYGNGSLTSTASGTSVPMADFMVI